ncbi:hypothetical protein [Burkholderia sp. 22PA0106]|uniref:hypothetical protein n=1 Tax=Burkholderia sp. 22PA0106 TaxID=3237371 RepID=UPI0039C374A6
MKISKFFAVLIVFFSSGVCADGFESVSYVTSTGSIVVRDSHGAEKQCEIDQRLKDVTPQFNWNKTIVILGDIEYVTVDSLIACQGGKVQVERIPKKVGAVADVNVTKKLYLALDVVAVRPFSFIATVGRLGSDRAVANFPGMYSHSKSQQKIAEESFGYNELLSLARISADGRYVSADGSMSCGPDSYPGVWDLESKKNVVRDGGCESLFGGP